MPLLRWFSETFTITDFTNIKAQLLAWASGHSSCAFLDNHHYDSDFHRYECLVAVGSYDAVAARAGHGALRLLQQFIDRYQGNWLFGHLGYELKAETEGTSGKSTAGLQTGFADVHFFVPEIVVRLQGKSAVVETVLESPEAVWENILRTPTGFPNSDRPLIPLRPLLSKQQYLEIVIALQQHIRLGDCYEINFCVPFTASGIIEPVSAFKELCSVSPMPFACFYRQQQQYLLCASPERFLQKEGSRIFSQPMKGTAPRHPEVALDEQQKQELYTSAKERSENVMVADLVRNDLSRICQEGSVQADKLFGIQTYPQVYQMVSTISGELLPTVSFTDILRATFPMGSMTGAPKKRVMELIDQYEPLSRGLFSGSVGYISPGGDFDFNVVIRSLFYNAEQAQLHYFAGSAITFYSQPEAEYEEVMLKTKAVRTILEQ